MLGVIGGNIRSKGVISGARVEVDAVLGVGIGGVGGQGVVGAGTEVDSIKIIRRITVCNVRVIRSN